MNSSNPLSVEDAMIHILDLQKRAFAFFVERRADREPDAPTRFQAHVLRIAADQDGISVSELAQALTVSPPTASQLVNTLVDRGFLRIVLSTTDRRRHEVHITDKGSVWLQERIKKRLVGVKRVLDELSPEERTDLIRLVERAVTIWQTNSSPEGSSQHGS